MSKKAQTVELLYTWIEQDDVGFIREQGFNFSPLYRFQMKDNGDGGYMLTWTEEPNRFNMWNYQNITNLTAVVGENGSGKSMLLRYLATAPIKLLGHLAASHKDYYHPVYDKRMLLIYRLGDSIKIAHNLGVSGVLLPEKQTCGGMKVSFFSIDEAVRFLSSQTIVHITNATSNVDFPKGQEMFIPVCFSPTNNSDRIAAFYEKIGCRDMERRLPTVFTRMQKRINHQHEVYGDSFNALAAASYHSQLQPKQSSNANNREFVIGVRNPSAWFEMPEQYEHIHIKERYKTFRELCWDYENPLGEYSKKCITDVLMDALCFELVTIACDGFVMEEDWDDSVLYDEIASDPYRFLLDYYGIKTPASYDTMIHHYRKGIESICVLDEILQECDQGGTCGPRNNAAVPVTIKCGTEAYTRFCRFIDEEMKAESSFILKHLIVTMPPQSSGEEALQNIFSWLSLPPHFDRVFGKESVPIQDNILLLLDEVDLFMHPEWQRRLLKMLTDRLNAEYKGKHIQIVMTTHSPLVLSDIPKNNVIYLQRKGDRCDIASGPQMEETFGANIFTLLKDSFFLDKSIGEFAHSRIAEVLKHLDQLKNSPKDTELQKICQNDLAIIDQIGEPVIRRKLMMMYEELAGIEPDQTDKQMLDWIQKRMNSKDPAALEIRAKLQRILREDDSV